MTDVFGPTFSAEVIAAGLGGAPFAWGNDGSISGRENLTPAQNSTLDAVIAAHNPTIQLPPKPNPAQIAADHEVRIQQLEVTAGLRKESTTS